MMLTITLFLFILCNIKQGQFVSVHPKLLVVSYDAFRYDYFNKNVTPYMNKLRNEGTHADYMMNIFVTKTFPNHHTMATGLYAETHGVVDNEVYDPVSGNITKYSSQLYHYDNRILPIWTINEKNIGRHSGTMMWPGSIFEYGGITPTYGQAFNETVNWEKRVDTLISWFVDPTMPINLGILYIEEPDYHGHFIGINNYSFNKILEKLDEITKYLHIKLEQYGLNDVNVIHLSDHGMATVTLDRIIDLNKYINSTDYTFVGTSPGLHIYPNRGKEQLIYQNLKLAAEETMNFKVYRKHEIPEKYHYGNNKRVGPIFVIANVGYAFQNLNDTIQFYKKKFNITVDSTSEFGLHGYDNGAREMHPIFFAKGPAFVPGCKLEPFKNTDLFPLFCKILDIKCPKTNGSLTNISRCLKLQSDNISILTYQIIFVGITLVITLIGIAGAILMFVIRKRRVERSNYRYRAI
ncbi:ectonucleotide pyrophosphatase/phosphodiesterase family member 5-like isoform X1 [Vespa velutina]|uniref:ectonucleotide pyrophosphatase/phosphodiesterase family member 5-like isoform X1 n=2 Tax=Vespa velutina TaxID=202808 RepID=UPI001FB2AB88|nr:ectonucleotide pyrophosphatase/phosphodiesterase family member 5-like isoform X1 [Vespa velutina]